MEKLPRGEEETEIIRQMTYLVDLFAADVPTLGNLLVTLINLGKDDMILAIINNYPPGHIIPKHVVDWCKGIKADKSSAEIILNYRNPAIPRVFSGLGLSLIHI